MFSSLVCSSTYCNADVEVRLNRDYRLHTLTGLIQITCEVTSSAHETDSLDYAFDGCILPAKDVETVVTSANPPGVLDNRNCTIIGDKVPLGVAGKTPIVA